ncbi:MAG: hypothetical protein NC119_10170, partial [Clostridiales bacterium]|nr:hypothetical protein [Clostridiales bacterium]
FYRNIVDRIVVYKDRKMDVHLKLIPEKWQGKILAGAQEIEAHGSEIRSCVCSEPICYTQLYFYKNKSVGLSNALFFI